MEKKIIIWVGCLLKNSEGKYLLLKRSANSSWGAGKWQLPGGKMEWGETVMDTLHREIKEETGGGVLNPLLLEIYTDQITAKECEFHAVQVVYSGSYTGERVDICKDHDVYEWMNLDEAVNADLVDGLSDFIKNHIK